MRDIYLYREPDWQGDLYPALLCIPGCLSVASVHSLHGPLPALLHTVRQGRRHGFLSGRTNRRQMANLPQNTLKIGKGIGFGPLHSRI